MTIEQLRAVLDGEGFNPRDYSLEGGNSNDTYCVAREAAWWVVYYTERGVRSDARRHTSEHDACMDLLSRLRELWTWMAKNRPKG